MICKKCNKLIPDGRNICPYCGSMITQPSNPIEDKDTPDVSGENSGSDILKSETRTTEQTPTKTEQTPTKTEQTPTKTEQTPTKTDNPDKSQGSKMDSIYVVIISVLATLLCCAIFFIIYQSTIGRAPANDVNTVAEDPATQSNEEDAAQEQAAQGQENGTDSQPKETDVASGAGGEDTDQAKSSPSIDVSSIVTPRNYFVYNGHSYAIYDAEKLNVSLTSYDEVKEFCRDQGGYLAVINDIYENDALFDFVSKNSSKTCFFGYSDDKNEDDWKWAYGYSTFTNWTYNEDEQQPDDGIGYGTSEDYAEFNYARRSDAVNDGTWNDAPFMRNTTRFICEWDCDLGLY